MEGAVETAEALLDRLGVEPDDAEGLDHHSGRWLRMPPEAISKPLQTRSYCQALMLSGSSFSSAPGRRAAW
jgi:hypothetical protein